MELIINNNQYDYEYFLDSQVSIIQIGLEGFCSGYLKTYPLEQISFIASKIHKNNKRIYLSLNIIANEDTIECLKKIITQLSQLEIDGFVVADFGIFQILKEANLTNKIVFNPVTNITNKYSANIINNLGINHCCIANELNLKDVLDISNYNDGNVEILAQGYYQICNSKRSLLTNFFKKHKLKNKSDYYYIKEESRDYSYPIIEINNETLVYIDRQRCILPYLTQISEAKIKYLRIDTMFLTLHEIQKHIETYNKVIKNPNLIDSELENIITYSNSNLKCLDNISILKKEK